MATKASADEGLKRLGGGRWQTRDERFTIEPQSGTWAVVDAEQTDELGLPLVRGPFGSLTAAKAAIEVARTSAAPESPLAARSTERPNGSVKTSASIAARGGKTGSSAAASDDADPKDESTSVKPPKAATKPTPRDEPAWLADLTPSDRRRARRLMDTLADAGASDPEGIARRDVAGGVPAAAAWAASQAISALGPDATPASVAKLLAAGRDAALDVRWRLVDGDDRPIVLDLDVRARRS